MESKKTQIDEWNLKKGNIIGTDIDFMYKCNEKNGEFNHHGQGSISQNEPRTSYFDITNVFLLRGCCKYFVIRTWFWLFFLFFRYQKMWKLVSIQKYKWKWKWTWKCIAINDEEKINEIVVRLCYVVTSCCAPAARPDQTIESFCDKCNIFAENFCWATIYKCRRYEYVWNTIYHAIF